MTGPRFIKYLLGRLTDNRDPIAINWVLKRLGDFDWMARISARYLARFADQVQAQRKISEHLAGNNNVSEWEEALLCRALLSDKTVRRTILDRARLTAGNRNAVQELRQWAVVLLGRHGSGADHQFIFRVSSSDNALAHSAILALQSANSKTRRAYYADACAWHADLKPIASAFKGAAVKKWPVFR